MACESRDPARNLLCMSLAMPANQLTSAIPFAVETAAVAVRTQGPRLGPMKKKDPESSLRFLYCARAKCTTAEFEQRVFWSAMPASVALLARLARRLSPDFFQKDYEAIAELGDARTHAEAQLAVSKFMDRAHLDRRRWRDVLRLRPAPQSLLDLADEIFP